MTHPDRMEAATPADVGDVAPRQRWLSALAKSNPERLEALWRGLDCPPAYRMVRPPEVGLAMVRARAGGTGLRFNLGEVTVARCAVSSEAGYLGIGYVQGRRPRHAELVAVFDALLQDPARRNQMEREVVQPLLAEQASLRQQRTEEAASTKVEFFTVVRGENE